MGFITRYDRYGPISGDLSPLGRLLHPDLRAIEGQILHMGQPWRNQKPIPHGATPR